MTVAEHLGYPVPHDGFLGTDVFEQFLVTIDFPKAVLTLEPFPGEASPPEVRIADAVRPLAKGFTEFFRPPKWILLPVSLEGLAPRAFSVESASPINMIADSRVSPGTSVPVGSGKQADLAFGVLHLRNVRVRPGTFQDESDAAGAEISGFLGLPVLMNLKVTIDYRNGAIAFRE